ncbi:glutaredoxin family protein [Virgibacillus halodenitrificans]|jgi:glutaredoxin|uniref:Glutaredoxin family protein n=1 Tax=Virgibacillus halodenitrificans TaxID=1482 RepID=A0AAC9NLJ1_VIRHA|nr:glutaredoxin family protein [Virgibacillus halodenitrificans]APC49090.1 thioredoxin family protein [Virgibacillus halodenitrificans]MBD1223320.1 glutaredoxin family protein [Virgibacillus halodenitrificans]MCG1026896.1 glutaredoxin family protein [Virgibacillus halodenitrificans]MCJ0932647.1 glutaredoxin family protein [Virgibacillus halodenitrificans]MEC2161011.1 glutaredoxin family protein [Virgibacillus halodenitrificans]
MLKVIFYTKEVCSLCDDAMALLHMLQHDYPFEIEERDIYTNDEWLERYQLLIPFVKINDITLDCEEVNIDSLEEAIKKYARE